MDALTDFPQSSVGKKKKHACSKTFSQFCEQVKQNVSKESVHESGHDTCAADVCGYASLSVSIFPNVFEFTCGLCGPQTEDLSALLSVIMLSIVVCWGQTDPQKENLQQTNPYFSECAFQKIKIHSVRVFHQKQGGTSQRELTMELPTLQIICLFQGTTTHVCARPRHTTGDVLSPYFPSCAVFVQCGGASSWHQPVPLTRKPSRPAKQILVQGTKVLPIKSVRYPHPQWRFIGMAFVSMSLKLLKLASLDTFPTADVRHLQTILTKAILLSRMCLM